MPIKQPTTTPMPDEILDYWMAELSGAELKCLLYIVRHTFGYGKHITGDAISIEQFQHGIRRRDTGEVVDRGTGLASRSTITTALNSLEARGLVKRTHRTSAAGDADSTLFALDVDNQEVWPHPTLAAAAGAEGSTKTGPPPTAGSTKSGLPTTNGSPEIEPPDPEGSPEIEPPPAQGSPESGLRVVQKLDPQETTRQEVPVVGTTVPTVMPSKGEAQRAQGSGRNNYHARAREGQTPITLHRGGTSLDPQAPWLPEMVEAIHKHWRGKAYRDDLNRWAAALWEHLEGSTPQERAAFLSYLFDGPYLSERSNASAVETTIRQDAERWKLRNKPSSKSSVRPARVPTHVQQERAHAHNPKNGMIDASSDPKAIEEIVAYLRRTQGEEKAQQWLRKIGRGA